METIKQMEAARDILKTLVLKDTNLQLPINRKFYEEIDAMCGQLNIILCDMKIIGQNTSE